MKLYYLYLEYLWKIDRYALCILHDGSYTIRIW